jgi:translocation protein SEC62
LTENKVKGLPAIKNEQEAIYVANLLLKHEYFHRSEKGAEKGVLEVSRDQTFQPSGYYTWIYLGSQTLSHLMTTLIIVGFLVVTCFPIWPQFLKVWMWYLSVTLLVFMLTFLSLRALIWLACWTCGYEFWILPRLFDESLAFCESFVPVWSFEPGSPGQGYYRSTVVVGFIAFLYWAYTQPTDFDSFIAAQKDFVADLYEGNLLTDVSQEAKENIDKPRMQSLEDILRELDEEEGEGTDSLIDQLLDSHDEDAEAAESEADAAEDAAELSAGKD